MCVALVMDNAFKETKQIECKIKENCKNNFYVSFKTGSKRTGCVVYGMTPAWKWLYIDQFPTSFHILAINDFFVIRKKNEETELSFCSVTFFATAQIPANHSVSFWVEVFS